MVNNMNILKKLLEEGISGENKLNWIDLINTIAGIALIVSLILIFNYPTNRYAILAACLSGGLVNIISGLKQSKDPKRKMTGLTFVMLGVIVIVLGFIIVEMI
jgi:hypothetical protein